MDNSSLSLHVPSSIRVKEQQEKRKAEQSQKISSFGPGDLVWVRCIRRGIIKWVPGQIESVESSVSYNVQVKDRVRQVSSSHLRPRSPGANCIEEDPLAGIQPTNPQIPEGMPPVIPPVVILEQPAPSTPASPVVEPIVPETPKKTPVIQDTPRTPVVDVPKTPVRPAPEVKNTPKVVKQPQAPVVEDAPVFSRKGRQIIRPKRLLD
ncbi:fibronectin-binding protein A-like [Frankliniella occidentalis]|uniref:Fibronectin-binding protein A-like n=1 Tax=Frankliniella occidentalis TaxID=133901 RepID=A0A9C6UCN4_FRAOC|nr:fibronectin-binding protein A-like [Frankliniella occidentalis]